MATNEFSSRLHDAVENYYQYNPDTLMLGTEGSWGGDSQTITVSCKGEPWFTLKCTNIFSGTEPLSELPVTEIIIEDDVRPYCRFIDGRSYDELLNMTYEEVGALGDSCFKDWQKREQGSYVSNDIIEIGYGVEKQETDKMDWTHMRAAFDPDYVFEINKKTGKVEAVTLSTGNFTSRKMDSWYVRSVDDLSDEEMIDLIGRAVEAAKAGEQDYYWTETVNALTAESTGFVCDSRYVYINWGSSEDKGMYPTFIVKGVLNDHNWYRAVFIMDAFRDKDGKLDLDSADLETAKIKVDDLESAKGLLVRPANGFNITVTEDQKVIRESAGELPYGDDSCTIFQIELRNDLF